MSRTLVVIVGVIAFGGTQHFGIYNASGRSITGRKRQPGRPSATFGQNVKRAIWRHDAPATRGAAVSVYRPTIEQQREQPIFRVSKYGIRAQRAQVIAAGAGAARRAAEASAPRSRHSRNLEPSVSAWRSGDYGGRIRSPHPRLPALSPGISPLPGLSFGALRRKINATPAGIRPLA